MNPPAPRLPKAVEADPLACGLPARLLASARPLWRQAAIAVACLDPQDEVKSSLRSAARAGFVVRGLEAADQRLGAEERGLEMIPGHRSDQAGVRVSRLLVLANDGSERFYRNVEGLLRRHAPRLYAVRLDIDEHALGELLYGADRVARLVLLVHKQAVAEFLLAVARQWTRDEAPD
jgi:hypothetical protein